MDDHAQSDEEVVRRILEGNTELFSILVERYQPKLLRYGQRFLATKEHIEDVVQEVFIKVYENLRSFNTARRFSPWIYRIAHNAFVNTLRERRREAVPFFDPDVLFPHPVAPDNPEKDASKTEMKRVLDQNLNELPGKYREPLVLFYLEELSYDEISEILRLPISTVGVRLNRGRSLLKKIFDLKGIDL